MLIAPVVQETVDAEVARIMFPMYLITSSRDEIRLGVPQDIEWAYSSGRLFILQSRKSR